MGLEIAKLRKSCKLCKAKRAQRYCLRHGKDICWVCCNSKRIDKRCPKECSYTIQQADYQEGQPPKTKIDSYTEHLGLISLEIDRWAELPEKQFSGKVPSEMATAAEGKKELEEYIDSLTDLPPKTILHLRKKFKLPLPKVNLDHYEDIAVSYLDRIIEQEWEATIEMMSNKDRYDKKLYRENYIKRRADNRLLKSVTSYYLIMSAISEKGDEALVYFEVNGKYDLTMHFFYEKDMWKVKSLIIGHPQIFYGISEMESQVYGLLYKNETEEALDKLKKFSEILIDSNEIFYLYGLYYSMVEEYPKASEMFLNCVEIQPDSYDYRYNFAFTSMVAGNQELAKEFYEELLTEKPEDVKTLNNIAVIYLNEGKIDKAKQAWKKCLEVDANFELAKNNLERFKDL